MSRRQVSARTILGAVSDDDGRLALFLKPPSAIAFDGQTVPAPTGLAVQLVPCLAVRADANGVRVAADITLPELLPTLYRPPVRAKGRDGFLPLGEEGVPLRSLPAALAWKVSAAGGEVLAAGTSEGALRLHRRIVDEATSFMSLEDGDLVLLALGAGVRVPRGRPVTVKVTGAAPVTFTIG